MDRDELDRIVERWAPALRKMAGTDDVVVTVCSTCQYEDRNGHAPDCVEKKTAKLNG